MIEYQIKNFSLGNFRCDAYENGKIIAYALFLITNNSAYGKAFWHLEDEINPLIIKEMLDSILIYLKSRGIFYLQTYPIKNKAILKMFSTFFHNAQFFKHKTKIDINEINSLKFNNYYFGCQTYIQDLDDSNKITVIIPSGLSGE